MIEKNVVIRILIEAITFASRDWHPGEVIVTGFAAFIVLYAITFARCFWHSNDIVVTWLAVFTVSYVIFNLLCIGLYVRGIPRHPPWSMLTSLILCSLQLAFGGFLLALSSTSRPARLWACIGFVGLMLLASAFNYYMLFQASAAV